MYRLSSHEQWRIRQLGKAQPYPQPMLASAESFGQTKLDLVHLGAPGQKFAENTRFVHGGIVLVGLSIPGSNNNKVHDDKDCTNKRRAHPGTMRRPPSMNL